MLENTFLNSAFISAVISAITAGLIYYFGINNNRKEKLENDRNEILKIAVEYPYLEYPCFVIVGIKIGQIQIIPNQRSILDMKCIQY